MIFSSIGIFNSDETCPAELISQTSLRAYYPFNGNTTDASGNSATLTEVGSPIYVNSFRSSFDLTSQLNGSSQYFSGITSTAIEPIGTTGWSFSCWISTDDFVNNQSIYDKRQPGSTGMRIVIRPGVPDILITWNNQNAGFSLPVGAFSTSAWHNIIVRQLAGTNNFQVFYDGVSLGTITRTSYSSNAVALNIGRDRGLNSTYMNGRIDDWYIYLRQITDEEVAGISAGVCPLKS